MFKKSRARGMAFERNRIGLEETQCGRNSFSVRHHFSQPFGRAVVRQFPLFPDTYPRFFHNPEALFYRFVCNQRSNSSEYAEDVSFALTA